MTYDGKKCNIIINFRKGVLCIIKSKYCVQNWLPYEYVYENGIIRTKDKSFIKIIKIKPINFNLKSNLEKEAILNSYKTFLKTCNFNLQILIQSNKENLSKHISNIEKNIKKENNENIIKLYKEYIEYINNLNQSKKSSSKNFYILIKEIQNNKKEKINENTEKIIFQNLNEKYFKIKECLSRCGNVIYEINSKEQTEEILYSFFNTRRYLNFE